MTEIVYRRSGDPVPLNLSEPLPDMRTLYLMAQNLLARLVQCSTSQGVPLPLRRFVYMSPVPADCEQAAVLFSGWSPLPPWDTLTSCDSYRWVGTFSAVITRCTPALPKRNQPPSVESMTEAALIASNDAEVLLCLAVSVDEVGPELAVNVTAPQGGFQSTELVLQLPAFGGLE